MTAGPSVSAMSALAVSVEQLPKAMAGRVTVDPEHGCWIASEPHDRWGYARWRGYGFHREAWKLLVGPVPPGLVLDHREDWGCVSKACCWPNHLLPVTNRVNVLRGTSFAAINAQKDECIHGHAFDLLNTIWRPGRRDCKQCRADRAAARREAARAANQPGLRLAA